MIQTPAYFETIRSRAAARWDQLENDPELAGPWHQLFKQVQSPRHVVSELLQNADDAGATEASVTISEGEFIFSHNGEDFSNEHFASLCRFGYSNKRALHTIGFRGIGFKSTFSLGDDVRLLTPTLAVRFGKARFTEPIWIGDVLTPSLCTEVRVNIKDEHRKSELEKNLAEWLRSPSSLLFFHHIRCLRINGEEVRWISQGVGPVNESEWMALTSAPEKPHLLIRSSPEEFPPDALEEIKQERMVSVEEETSFPPCRIEIVLGLEGRLFVILPTGVKSDLPFACNAPFVQDPARVKIKDPETSPTNRWLLARAGNLAAHAMLAWVRDDSLSTEKRCGAYSLLSDVNRDDSSLEGTCAAIAEKAIDESISKENFLLSESGSIEPWGGCAAVPDILLDIWSHEQISTFLIDDKQPVLSHLIDINDRQKLIHWGCVQELESHVVVRTLLGKHLPKPDTWRKLMLLWSNQSSFVHSNRYNTIVKSLKILPVQGKDELYAPEEVVRLAEKKLLQSEDDWQFLGERLLVLNQNWPRYLAEQRRKAEEQKDALLCEHIEKAYGVLDDLGLTEASDVSRVIQQVADGFFVETCAIRDCIRLAQIAATLGASVNDDFQFITHAGNLVRVKDCILYDIHSDLDTYVETTWYERHVIHDDYLAFHSCTAEEWRQWVTSGRSGLLTFVPIRQTKTQVWNRYDLEKILKERGIEHEPYYRYVTDDFIIEDWDFSDNDWRHWRNLMSDDKDFSGKLLGRILEQPRGYWTEASSAKALQVATTGKTRAINNNPLLPSWIVILRGLPCLQDTRGNYRHPAELLRRTPETESLLEVEPFVRAELDTEATRQLLILLGVRDKPTGPGRLLDRLRALSTVNSPPVYEVEKWYHRLDQLIGRCSTEEFEEIKNAFDKDKIILTEDGQWVRASEVFLAADEEDVPGAALVHPSFRHLALWRKVEVADRPTADLAMEWLAGLESGQSLSQDESRRVRSLLPKYPERIWSECGHWLNLEGEWMPVGQLVYSLTMQSLVPWKHLFKIFKQKTADLQKLSAEICQQHPFSKLQSLAGSIEEHFQNHLYGLPETQNKPWLNALGKGLCRVVMESQEETMRVRELANRLAATDWQIASGLQTVPYIDGTPAGTSRRIDVLWKNSLLYVEDRSAAKMAKVIAQELGRVFNRQEIADAIKLCYDRSSEFVIEYLEENFKLDPVAESDMIDDKPVLTHVTQMEAELTDEADAMKSENPSDGSSISDGTGDVREDNDAGTQADKNNDDFEASSEDIEENESVMPSPKHTKPAKPSLIERFAKAKGYVKDGTDCFYHPDGSRIKKVTGGLSFPWERLSASGELIECYWPKEHCIERDALQLDADVWKLCEDHPDKYTLLLVDPEEAPIEITGRRLMAMREGGQLALYPANYRLVFEHNGSQS